MNMSPPFAATPECRPETASLLRGSRPPSRRAEGKMDDHGLRRLGKMAYMPEVDLFAGGGRGSAIQDGTGRPSVYQCGGFVTGAGGVACSSSARKRSVRRSSFFLSLSISFHCSATCV